MMQLLMNRCGSLRYWVRKMNSHKYIRAKPARPNVGLKEDQPNANLFQEEIAKLKEEVARDEQQLEFFAKEEKQNFEEYLNKYQNDAKELRYESQMEQFANQTQSSVHIDFPLPPESLAETSRRILGAEKENAEVKPGVSELPRKNTWQALSSSAKRAVSVDAEDTLGDIQQSYQAKCLDVLMKSSKMRARLDYEYFRGEDKIDNMVLGEGYSYLVQEYLCMLQAKKDGLIDAFYSSPDPEVAKSMEKLNELYHEKQKKYELDQWIHHLNNYPGTLKGPRKEDDILGYIEWGNKKMPKFVQEEFKIRALRTKAMESGSNEIGENGSTKMESAGFVNKLKGNRPSMPTIWTEEDKLASAKKLSQVQLIQFEEVDVPLLPTTKFTHYQQYFREIMAWFSFRNSYYAKHMEQIYKTNSYWLCKTHLKEINIDYPRQKDQYFELEANIPSLYRYYKCLPKVIQDNPGLKDIYLGLEYKSPDYTYEEKEQGLNWAATQVLPYDPISEKAITEFTHKKKEYVTPLMQQKMFTLDPIFTFDMDQFLHEIKQQDLKGLISAQQKAQRFPEPPQTYKEWEEGAPNLPVDFYDNEDGFWDQIISKKLKRYDKCQPMLKTRKYFTH